MSNVRDQLAQAHSRMEHCVMERGTKFGPCLLISRQYGSGGGLIARRVGELLDWNVFDARIVDEIARSAHVHQRLVESVDEHVRSRWERTWHELLPDDLSDRKYLRHLREVVMALGHYGNVVIVGRGAQYFLPTRCAVRARLVAPLEIRAKRVAERLKLPLDEAQLRVLDIDKERVAFVWKTFRRDVNSPLNQDITINTEEVSIESAAKIVLAALHEKLGVSPKEQLVLSDERHGQSEICATHTG